MIYAYVRVSTDRQTVENQRFEIRHFCQQEKLIVDGWIEETISGTMAYDKRCLGRLLRRVRKGDVIICSELSRLGRSLFMIMEILGTCMHKGCRVYTVKEGYRLGEDIQSKVLAFAFGLSAEIERNLISQRTREALSRRKAEGMHLGREKGSCNKAYKLDEQEQLILSLLENGMTTCSIARELGVSRSTLGRWLRRRNNGASVELRKTKTNMR